MTREISLAGNPIEVEVAQNDAHRYKGLSERDELGKDEGMMFVWPMEKEHGLVMRDMNFGVDMVFADAEGEVTKVHSADPDGEGTTAFSKYAVELPQGYCEVAGVEKGDRLELDAGGLGKISRDTMSKSDLFKDLEGVSFYSEINDTEVKIVDVEGDKVRVTDDENEWWERMEDVRDKITDGAWEEKEDPCWEGYEQVGMKEGENGEKVPDCVPKDSEKAKVLKAIDEVLEDFRNSPTTKVGQFSDVDKQATTSGGSQGGSSIDSEDSWIPYVGPDGGEGWQSTGSGEVRYQQDPPGEVYEDYGEDYWERHNTDRYEETDPERDEPVTEFTDDIPDFDMSDSTPEEFSSTVQQKIDNEPEMGAFLTAHPPEEMEDHDLIKAEGEGVNAGAAVSPEGDLQNLYKIEGPSGTGRTLLEEGIDRGGRTLDCYAGYLNRAYRQHGFREVARQEFNEEFAPDDWNYEEYGKPDVVFMAYMPDAEPEQTENYESDWGQAKELSRERANWDNTMEEKDNEIRIPEDAEGAAEIASEGEEEEGMTEEQRAALAETQARLIGDL